MKPRNIFQFLFTLFLSACGSVIVVTPTPTTSTSLPDLAISNVYLAMQGMPGGSGNCVTAYAPYEIRAIVHNQGQAPATNVAVVEVSTSHASQLGILQAGESMEVFLPISPGGSYNVSVDPQNVVEESNEANNLYSYLAPTPTPPALCSPTPPMPIETLPAPTAFLPSSVGLIYADIDLAQIWRITSNMQPVRLMDGIHAEFSPDGLEVLYELSGDLWLAKPMDGPAVNITNTANSRETAAQWWAANPGKIIFNSDPEHNGPHTGFLSMINKDGSDLITLSDTPSYTHPSVSGDGRSIAYDALGIPMLYEIGIGSRAFDSTRYGYPPRPGTVFTSPSFSADGHWLTWWISGEMLEPQRRFSLVLFDLAGNTSRIVHEYTLLSGTMGWLPAPRWSPSGNWIAYETRGETTPQDLWIVHRDGGIGTQLNLATNPVWGPNSQQLAYVQWPPAADSYLSAVTSIIEVPSWVDQQVGVPAGSIPLAWPPVALP